MTEVTFGNGVIGSVTVVDNKVVGVSIDLTEILDEAQVWVDGEEVFDDPSDDLVDDIDAAMAAVDNSRLTLEITVTDGKYTVGE